MASTAQGAVPDLVGWTDFAQSSTGTLALGWSHYFDVYLWVRAYAEDKNANNGYSMTQARLIGNAPPRALNQTISMDEDGEVSLELPATDLNNDALSFTLISEPNNGVLSGVAPNLHYKPSANFFGQDTLTFIVNDGYTDSQIAEVRIIVDAINDPPKADAGSDMTVFKGTLEILDASGSNDIDDGIKQYLWTQISGLELTLLDPALAHASFIAPEIPLIGFDVTFQVEITDQGGLTDADTVMVTVRGYTAYDCDLDLDGDVDGLDLMIFNDQLDKGTNQVPPAIMSHNYGTTGVFFFLDFNLDGKVNDDDFAVLTQALGSQIGDLEYNLSVDLNDDGVVDDKDLEIFTSQYEDVQ